MAAATLGEQSITGILGLTLALGQEGEVGGGLGLVLDCAGLLECEHVTLALEADWGHKALDLWGLGVLLATYEHNVVSMLCYTPKRYSKKVRHRHDSPRSTMQCEL